MKEGRPIRAGVVPASGAEFVADYPLPVEELDCTSPDEAPRVLLFSCRNTHRRVWQGPVYEFEDVIASVESVDMLAPHVQPDSRVLFFRQLEAAARRLGRRTQPRMVSPQIEGEYDLFVAVLHFSRQMEYLQQLKGWRSKCRKAVCVIFEQWLPWLEGSGEYLKMLAQFDHVFVFSRWSIPAMRLLSGRPVDFMPQGADVLAMSPYPNPPLRPIDVYSIGRRPKDIHCALLRMMRENRLAYIFDSASLGEVPSIDYIEHRALLRHLMQRSQFFLATRHNDSPEFVARTGGEEALAGRYFEGIAGGAAILGSAPDCDDFRENFDWPDAVFEVSPNGIEETLTELKQQPERVTRASHANMRNALLRHDWVYRWQTILRTLGLPDCPAVLTRAAALAELAAMVPLT